MTRLRSAGRLAAIGVALAGVAAACERGGELPLGDPARADVVLVSIDTLRADHLSSHGYSRPTSPFLDRLAQEGTRFTQARSASPWTLPAHVTLLTGQLPGTHKVVDDTVSPDPAVPVLPQLFGARGFATGGFVASLYVSRVFGFERGFERFEDFGIHDEARNLGGSVAADRVVDAALAWWRELPAGKPVFLFLHFYDVHYRYDPPPPYDAMFDAPPRPDDPPYRNYHYFKAHPLDEAQLAHQVAQYDEAIRYVDDQLARLAAVLRASDRAVRWVVLSDHGEEFGERGSWGHAHTLYAEQLAIPLIVSGDGLPAGRVQGGAVGNHDVAPTVAGWIGAGDALRADGIDLTPVLHGSPPPARPLLAETSRFQSNRISLLEGSLRLEWDLASDRAELFDPFADPREREDLSTRRPDDAARMKARVGALLGRPWQARAAGQVASGGVLLDARGRHERLPVVPGASFQVLPYDAEVRFLAGSARSGPWRAVGGPTPGEGDPLVLREATGAARVELDAGTRAALEALGYVQEGDVAGERAAE